MSKMSWQCYQRASECGLTNRCNISFYPCAQCAKAQHNTLWYACRSGREQHKCGFLGFRDIKLASGCPRFSMGQFHNRYIEAIDGRGAIRQKGDRFRKLNDIANLASGQVLIKACSSRSNFPSCQQIGEESRGATMDN